MHALEGGYEERNRPVVVLLHGFPELAYSWRKVMSGLSAAGFHVIAPDLRGYGDSSVPPEMTSYTILHLVGDIVALICSGATSGVHCTSNFLVHVS